MSGSEAVTVYFGGEAHEVWTNDGLQVNYTGRLGVLAVNEGGRERACAAAHTLKGVCGNLSMDGLYALFTAQVEALRRGDMDEAARLMAEIAPAWEAAAAAIGDNGDGAR